MQSVITVLRNLLLQLTRERFHLYLQLLLTGLPAHPITSHGEV